MRLISVDRPFTKMMAGGLILGLLGLMPTRAMAWGENGHRIVAHIANQLLTEKGQKLVKDLLGPSGETLESVAVWPDSIRGSYEGGQRPETKQWHFVDIPLKDKNGVFISNYDPTRDCKRTPYGDCIILALDQFRSVLANPRLGLYKNSRYEALKFIIHFVGDLHQPLHCADNNDHGGNQVKAKWFGEDETPYGYQWSLHSIWDDGIIDQRLQMTNFNYVEYAGDLLKKLSDDQKTYAKLQSEIGTNVDLSTTIKWAEESHKTAIKAYDNLIPTNAQIKELGQPYLEDN